MLRSYCTLTTLFTTAPKNIFTTRPSFTTLPSFTTPLLRPSFSTQTSRQRLAQFFKLTHPDVMSNAPEKIKEENLRSTKSLNYYLDQASQNKGHPLTQLSFYVADKDNLKSRKFLLFQVDLLPLQPGLPPDQLKTHIDKTIGMLLNSVMQAKVTNDPFLKKEIRRKKRPLEEKEVEDNWEQDQYEVGPLRKEHFNLEQQLAKEASRQSLDYGIFASLAAERHQQVVQGIEQQLHCVDRANTKALSWARLIMQDSKHSRRLQQVFYQLIDPRMIYFAPSLSSSHFDAFTSRLVNVAKADSFPTARQMEMLKAVFQDMEQQEPQIYLQVAHQYSSDALPGFLSIPFDFQPDSLYEYYFEHRYDILDNRRQFELMIDLIKKEKKTFSDNFPQKLKIQRAKSLAESEQAYRELKQLVKLLDGHQSSAVLSTIHQINLSGQYTQLQLATTKDALRGPSLVLQVPYGVQAKDLEVLL